MVISSTNRVSESLANAFAAVAASATLRTLRDHAADFGLVFQMGAHRLHDHRESQATRRCRAPPLAVRFFPRGIPTPQSASAALPSCSLKVSACREPAGGGARRQLQLGSSPATPGRADRARERHCFERLALSL